MSPFADSLSTLSKVGMRIAGCMPQRLQSNTQSRGPGFIEDYLRDVVYPMYANTHTESSSTGMQTGCLREEARRIISSSLNASPDEYVVCFTGTGMHWRDRQAGPRTWSHDSRLCPQVPSLDLHAFDLSRCSIAFTFCCAIACTIALQEKFW